MNILVKMLPPWEVDEFWLQFEAIDKDKSGFIDAAELAQALKDNKKITIPDEEIDKIIKKVDYAENGWINYSEFIAATLKVAKVLNEARLWTLFK